MSPTGHIMATRMPHLYIIMWHFVYYNVTFIHYITLIIFSLFATARIPVLGASEWAKKKGPGKWAFHSTTLVSGHLWQMQTTNGCSVQIPDWTTFTRTHHRWAVMSCVFSQFNSFGPGHATWLRWGDNPKDEFLLFGDVHRARWRAP